MALKKALHSILGFVGRPFLAAQADDNGDSEKKPSDSRSRPPDPRFPRRGTPIPVGGPGRPMRTLALWLMILVVSVIGAQMYFSNRDNPVELTYTQFVAEVEKSNIQKITIDERGEATGELPKLLMALSKLYEASGRDRMKRVLQLIEPLAIIVIGGIIGVIVTSIILAITSVNDVPL